MNWEKFLEIRKNLIKKDYRIGNIKEYLSILENIFGENFNIPVIGKKGFSDDTPAILEDEIYRKEEVKLIPWVLSPRDKNSDRITIENYIDGIREGMEEDSDCRMKSIEVFHGLIDLYPSLLGHWGINKDNRKELIFRTTSYITKKNSKGYFSPIYLLELFIGGNNSYFVKTEKIEEFSRFERIMDKHMGPS